MKKRVKTIHFIYEKGKLVKSYETTEMKEIVIDPLDTILAEKTKALTNKEKINYGILKEMINSLYDVNVDVSYFPKKRAEIVLLDYAKKLSL